MADLDECELHEAAIVVGTDESETLLRLVRSPLGDECQHCAICRLAREYIEHRLAERSGRVFPAGQTGDAIWQQLQRALEGIKSATQKPT
jgi:hypothetical protein